VISIVVEPGPSHSCDHKPVSMDNHPDASGESPRTDIGPRSLVVACCAAATLACYLILPSIAGGLAVAEPSFASEVFGYAKTLTKQSLTQLQESGGYPSTPTRFFALTTGLFILYALAYRLVRGGQPRKVEALVFGAGAVFLFAQLIAPILLSTDLYVYVFSGRLLTVYGASAYDPAPSISRTDPFLPLFGSDYSPSVYGPLWNLMAGGLAYVGGTRIGLTVLLFRVGTVLAALLTGALIWWILRRTAPERTAQGLVLFLWNPLLVIETGLSGHNDAVMLAFVLLGVALHLRGWKVGAVVALVCSALVKLVTGMLVPLYIWMVLRQATTWRERGTFLAKGALATSLVYSSVCILAREGLNVPAARAPTASAFYDNNFHDLILRGLRRYLGEDPESIGAPYYFQGWWLAAKTNTELRGTASPVGQIQEHLAKGDKLFVMAPQKTEWARAYDPGAHRKGYIDTSFFDETTRPSQADRDPFVKSIEGMAIVWPTVQTANRWVRMVTWILFSGFGLLAAWRTRNLDDFVIWAAAALIASYYLVFTQIWPWYINWGLALGALAPASLPSRFAVLLSASVLTLYVTIGFEGSAWPWLYTVRSLPAFVLPLILYFVLCFFRGTQFRLA
jgi:hypothetical protein